MRNIGRAVRTAVELGLDNRHCGHNAKQDNEMKFMAIQRDR